MYVCVRACVTRRGTPLRCLPFLLRRLYCQIQLHSYGRRFHRLDKWDCLNLCGFPSPRLLGRLSLGLLVGWLFSSMPIRPKDPAKYEAPIEVLRVSARRRGTVPLSSSPSPTIRWSGHRGPWLLGQQQPPPPGCAHSKWCSCLFVSSTLSMRRSWGVREILLLLLLELVSWYVVVLLLRCVRKTFLYCVKKNKADDVSLSLSLSRCASVWRGLKRGGGNPNQAAKRCQESHAQLPVAGGHRPSHSLTVHARKHDR